MIALFIPSFILFYFIDLNQFFGLFVHLISDFDECFIKCQCVNDLIGENAVSLFLSKVEVIDKHTNSLN